MYGSAAHATGSRWREGSQDLGALGAGTQVQHCSPLLLSAPQQSLLVACILGTDYYVLFPLPTQRAKPKDTCTGLVSTELFLLCASRDNKPRVQQQGLL